MTRKIQFSYIIKETNNTNNMICVEFLATKENMLYLKYYDVHLMSLSRKHFTKQKYNLKTLNSSIVLNCFLKK